VDTWTVPHHISQCSAVLYKPGSIGSLNSFLWDF